MTGWKTMIWALFLAVSVPMLEALAAFNWVEYFGPTVSMVIVAVITAALRAVTKTPVFKSA